MSLLCAPLFQPSFNHSARMAEESHLRCVPLLYSISTIHCVDIPYSLNRLLGVSAVYICHRLFDSKRNGSARSVWSSGMIPALGAGGPGFNPPNGPMFCSSCLRHESSPDGYIFQLSPWSCWHDWCYFPALSLEYHTYPIQL